MVPSTDQVFSTLDHTPIALLASTEVKYYQLLRPPKFTVVTEEARTSIPAACRKIMVVDDNEEVRAVFSIGLEIQNHEVIQCANGHEAIELFQKEMPEIVILDQSLPDTQGIDVGKQIRNLKNGQNTVVALITGTHDATLRQATEDAGLDDFLLKPLSIKELACWVNKVSLDPNSRLNRN